MPTIDGAQAAPPQLITRQVPRPGAAASARLPWRARVRPATSGRSTRPSGPDDEKVGTRLGPQRFEAHGPVGHLRAREQQSRRDESFCSAMPINIPAIWLPHFWWPFRRARTKHLLARARRVSSHPLNSFEFNSQVSLGLAPRGHGGDASVRAAWELRRKSPPRLDRHSD